MFRFDYQPNVVNGYRRKRLVVDGNQIQDFLSILFLQNLDDGLYLEDFDKDLKFR